MRADAAVRRLAADGLAPPQEAARGRPRRRRAPRPVGLLLRQPRSTEGASSMAVLRPHLALTVSDVERSIPFYEALFGAEPEKRQARLREVLGRRARRSTSRSPRASAAELGAFNHAGIQVAVDRRRARREGAPRRRRASRPSTRWTRPAATRARTRSGCATPTARRGRSSPRTRTSRSDGATRRRLAARRGRRCAACCARERPSSSSTTRRRSTGAGRTRSGRRSRSTSRPTSEQWAGARRGAARARSTSCCPR